MANEAPRLNYEFGPFRVDALRHLLLRAGVPVALTPKAFEMLLLLLEERGRVVEKDELLERLWPDSVVEEANLAVNISALRKALGESRGHPNYIVTVPGRGYRFAAEVSISQAAVSEIILRQRASASLVIEEEESEQSATETAVPVKPRRLANWAAPFKRHKLAVSLACATLIVTVGAALAYFHRAPVLTDKDTILLADFENKTGDAVFDGTLKQALAVQLEQSPFLNIFPDDRVRETLKLMKRAPDERVLDAVAREVCQRQNLKALLAGAIASLGNDYVIRLEAVNAQSGEVIARTQAEAAGKEQVLKALGQAATKLREKLGESLHSIQQYDVALAQATTSLLEALKAYSLGSAQMNQGRYSEAIPFYQQALELDPQFVSAYSSLAAVYNYLRKRDLAAEYAAQAYALRDRVSEPERLAVSYRYFDSGTREIDKAIEVLEVWRQTYPRSYNPVSGLTVEYLRLGQYEKVAEAARAALQLDPHRGAAYANLVTALARLNRGAEAQQLAAQAQALKLETSSVHYNLYALAFMRGDTEAMKQQLAWWHDKSDEYWIAVLQSDTAAFGGRLREAQEFSRQAVELAARHKLEETGALQAAVTTLRAAVFGQCRQVPADVNEALAVNRNTDALRFAARALASCGEVGQAQALADEITQRNPKDTVINFIWLPIIRAAIELQHNRPAQAIEFLQVTTPYEAATQFWSAWLRGQAYLRLNAPQAASAEFQQILDHWSYDPLNALYPLAHLEVARAAALAGDTIKSRQAYEAFLSLWKDADTDLPTLREARQEYAQLVARAQ